MEVTVQWIISSGSCLGVFEQCLKAFDLHVMPRAGSTLVDVIGNVCLLFLCLHFCPSSSRANYMTLSSTVDA